MLTTKLLLLAILFAESWRVSGKSCTKSVSYSQRYTTSCGLFGWERCTRHRTQYRSKRICCTGWKSSGSTLTCDKAICGGKTDPEACNGYFPNSHIKYSDGSIQTRVSGTCDSPNKCTCNKQGFFSTGPNCDMCTAITNCDLEVCKTRYDQTCSRCEGTVREQTGYRAYEISSNRKSCEKACSWRGDSTPCYPGTCTNELAANCRCSSEFSGYRCDTITNKPSINYNALTLTARSGGKTEAPGNINKGPPQDTVWTNMVNPASLHYKFEADYRPNVPKTRPVFVTDFKVGIISGKVVLERVRKSSGTRTITQSCSGSQSSLSPNQAMFTCEKTLSDLTQLSLPFKHLDELRFTFSVSNGGFIEIKNMENGQKGKKYLKGKETSNSYKIMFDTVSPYHCQLNSGCSSNMLTDLDVSTKLNNRFSWDGWQDDDAGIGRYRFEVFELKPIQNKLSVVRMKLDAVTTNKYYDFNFPNAGVFSLILTAYDRAGNHKNSRRLVIFDDSSSVDTVPRHFLRVTSALQVTDYTWQNDLSSVTIDWTNRYINKKHDNGGFLLEVRDDPAVDTDYDDKYGIRTTKAIDNVQGILNFKTVEKLYHLGQTFAGFSPADTEYKDLKLKQQVILTPAVKDGDTLKYFIRAYDVVGVYKEENVTVHFDSSPPVVENLWLTKGDQVNLSVHEMAELDKMTIEWIAYDYHSGLEEIQWKIVDRVSGQEYGRQSISPQGDFTSLEDCENKNKSTSQTSECYCSADNKCFNRHFQIQPSRTSTNCEHVNNVTVNSEHDYHITITVMNQAKMVTTVTKKLTIDNDPPVAGQVHDGKCGEPEVDVQSTLDIYAHWDGFSDKESGIKFYQYGFSTSCLDASRFDVDLQKTQNIGKTIVTNAKWTAPGNGKYYVTVVAYNNNGVASTPVCSDGITIQNA